MDRAVFVPWMEGVGSGGFESLKLRYFRQFSKLWQEGQVWALAYQLKLAGYKKTRPVELFSDLKEK